MPVRGAEDGVLIPRRVPEEGGCPNPVVARGGMPAGFVGVVPEGRVGVWPAGFVGVIPAGLDGVPPVMPAAAAISGSTISAAAKTMPTNRMESMTDSRELYVSACQPRCCCGVP